MRKADKTKTAILAVGIVFASSCNSYARDKNNHPNIIIIKTDQQRYDLLGCMGNKIIKTPNLDRLAESSFILKNEFTVSPLSVPSRTSFFTGKYVCSTRKTGNDPINYINNEWSFIEPLKEEGYRIGIAGKNHTFSNKYFEKYFDYREEYSHWGKEYGNITNSDKKVRYYLTHDPRPGYKGKMLEGLIPGPMPFNEEDCPAFRIADDGIRFIEQNRDKPFFLYYSFGDPHFPIVAPEPFYSMYNPKDIPLEGDGFDWEGHPFRHFVQSQANGYDAYTREEKARIAATYYGQISMADAAIGRLLNKLKELNLMGNTIIVFTSDHGDWGGNYGIVAKTGGFQETLVRIPGIIYLPNLKGNGKGIEAQISNIDVLPTIFDYLKVKYPKDVRGKSFLDVLEGKTTTHRDVIFSEVGVPVTPPNPIPRSKYAAYSKKEAAKRGNFWFADFTSKGRMVMIRKGDWKYCYYVGDIDELYNFKKDKLELHNLSNDPKYAQKKEELKNELIGWLLTEPVLK